MKYAKVVIFIVLVAIVALVSWHFGWTEQILNGELADALSGLVNENPALAYCAYIALTAVGSAVLALPGFLFSIAAGAIFGPIAGTLLCWVSMWLGACAAFVVSRYLLKDAVKPRLARHETLDKLLFSGAHESDVFLLAVTRLVPVIPFSLQNLAYGITDIGFAPYALYTALFLLPGTAASAAATAGVIDPEIRVACLIAAAVLLAVSLAAAFLLKKKANLE